LQQYLLIRLDQLIDHGASSVTLVGIAAAAAEESCLVGTQEAEDDNEHVHRFHGAFPHVKAGILGSWVREGQSPNGQVAIRAVSGISVAAELLR
jgi:hypothetical protein